MKDLIKQLNEFKEIEPDEKTYHVTRSILLNTIEASSSKKRQGFQFKSLFFNLNIFIRTVFPTMKMATISLVVVVTIFLTGLGAQAAGPDDILFPGKLIGEQLRLFLAKDSDKTQIRFEHIGNRLREIDQLIKNNKTSHIVKATRNIESSLQKVKEDLKSMRSNKNIDDKKIIELAALIDLKTNEISENLKHKTVEIKNNKDSEIKETIKASESLSKDALEVIVNSDVKLSNEELKLIAGSINNKIELQKDRFQEIDQKISRVKEEVAKVKQIKNNQNNKNNLLISSKKDISNNEDVLLQSKASSTLDNNQTVTTTVNDLNLKEKETKPVEFNISKIEDLKPQEISTKLESAEQSLKTNDYSGALRKLEEVEFYIDLTDKTLENTYGDRINKIEDKIEDVKGVTEQVVE